jgi:hypothetical protein
MLLKEAPNGNQAKHKATDKSRISVVRATRGPRSLLFSFFFFFFFFPPFLIFFDLPLYTIMFRRSLLKEAPNGNHAKRKAAEAINAARDERVVRSFRLLFQPFYLF